MFSYFFREFLVFVRLCLVTFYMTFWCLFVYVQLLFRDFLVFVRLCSVTFYMTFWCLFVYVQLLFSWVSGVCSFMFSYFFFLVFVRLCLLFRGFLVFVRLCLVTFYMTFWCLFVYVQLLFPWVSGVCSFMFSYFFRGFLVFVRLCSVTFYSGFLVFVRLCSVTFFVSFWCLFVYV